MEISELIYLDLLANILKTLHLICTSPLNQANFRPEVEYFQTGRTILAVNSVPMFIKLLMLFEYKPTLGPILLMLREMCKDLGVFLLLLVIFLLGFGVSYVAILIPPDRFSWQSMSALFMYPYFQMFGDFYLEVFEVDEVRKFCCF